MEGYLFAHVTKTTTETLEVAPGAFVAKVNGITYADTNGRPRRFGSPYAAIDAAMEAFAGLRSDAEYLQFHPETEN